MRKGVQVKANQDGGVQEAIGGSRIDQCLHKDRQLTRYEEVHHESKVLRGGKGEGCRPARFLLAGMGVF